METKKLTIDGIYLGYIVSNPNRIYISICVLHYCDAEVPKRDIVPEVPYRLNVLLIQKNTDKRCYDFFGKLRRGSYVTLQSCDLEQGTIMSIDDIIIQKTPTVATFTTLAERLDEEYA
ncbi:MAG: hypothetical protein IJ864_02230 [Alphaproteobacteria bacterium]|nr:hypothetical protein [Alphaproteobacteria bacterium]